MVIIIIVSNSILTAALQVCSKDPEMLYMCILICSLVCFNQNIIFTGCEDIIKVHFTIQKDVVLKQCSEWLRQTVSPEQERRLRKAVDELRVQLDKIE